MQGIYKIRNTRYLAKIIKIDKSAKTYQYLGFICIERTGEAIVETAWSKTGKNISIKKFNVIFYKQPVTEDEDQPDKSDNEASCRIV